MATLSAVLTVIGAGAYLAPRGAASAFYTHSGNSSVHHGWQTPAPLLRRLYEVFGSFDLDPCSPTGNRRQAPVKAKVYYTAADDGLSLPWHGVCFLNPPYGPMLKHWTAKARQEVSEGRAVAVVALVPARTDTGWWHRDIAGHADVFLLKGRLSFGKGGNSAPFPSALAVWGADAPTVAKIREAFPEAWYVPVPPRDRIS